MALMFGDWDTFNHKFGGVQGVVFEHDLARLMESHLEVL